VRFVHFQLELKRRQSFFSMLASLLFCRSIFKLPGSVDSVWLDVPLKRPAEDKLAGEILIVNKKGFYLEEIQRNMPHVEKLLKPMLPNFPCQQLLKQKKYPLLFLAEHQDLLDAFFADPQTQKFFAGQAKVSGASGDEFGYLRRVVTIHLTDQKLYGNFDYEVKMRLAVSTSTFQALSVCGRGTQQEKESRNAESDLVRHSLHLCDVVSSLKLKHQVSSSILKRREKAYESK
jgi:hypothetical protein